MRATTAGAGRSKSTPQPKAAPLAVRAARASAQTKRSPVPPPRASLGESRRGGSLVYSARRQRIEHLIDSSIYGWMHPTKIAHEYKRLNLTSAEKGYIEKASARRGDRAMARAARADIHEAVHKDIPAIAHGADVLGTGGMVGDIRHGRYASAAVDAALLAPVARPLKIARGVVRAGRGAENLREARNIIGVSLEEASPISKTARAAKERRAARQAAGTPTRVGAAGRRLATEERGAVNPLAGTGEELPKPPRPKAVAPIVKAPGEKVAEALPGAKKQRRLQEQGYRPERAKRAVKMEQKFWDAGGGEQGALEARKELRGELPKLRVSTIEGLTQEHRDLLFNQIWNNPDLKNYQRLHLDEGLRKLLAGKVPTKSEIKALEQQFGSDAVSTLKEGRTPTQTLAWLVDQGWNAPRVLSASYDISFLGRQGLAAATHSPSVALKGMKETWRAGKPGGKAYFEQRAAERLQDPEFLRSMHAGVDYTGIPGTTAHEDPQMIGDLAERFVPGIAWSGRTYSAAGNEERYHLWQKLQKLAESESRFWPGGYNRITGKGYIGHAERVGQKAKGHPWKAGPLGKREPFDRERFDREVADVVNVLTGRGHFNSKVMEGMVPGLTRIMFSPRLFYSRLKMMNPVTYTAANPFARRQIMRSAAGIGLTTMTIMEAASQIPGVDVGMDPRSADFGKIRIGRTRVDLLGGFQQPVVLMVKLATGQAINSQTGELSQLGPGFSSTSQWDILDRFRRSKMHPTFAMFEDMLRHTDYAYKPVTWKRELYNRFVPLLLQDSIGVGQDYGPFWGIAAYGGGALGAGLQSYGPAPEGSAPATGSTGVILPPPPAGGAGLPVIMPPPVGP